MPSKSKTKSSGLKNTSQATSQHNNSENTKFAKPQTVVAVDPKEPSNDIAVAQEPVISPKQRQSSPQAPQPIPEDAADTASGVNRKKQKRRLKEAAKRAASQPQDTNYHVTEHRAAVHRASPIY